MDLYRYFHPHHNPRLRNTALRLQEVAELQQAAIELTRALKRAQLRASRNAEKTEPVSTGDTTVSRDSDSNVRSLQDKAANYPSVVEFPNLDSPQNNRPAEPPQPSFGTAIEAANLLVSELIKITEQLPEDDLQTMKQLLSERHDAPGWETWTQLLSQRLVTEELENQLFLPETASAELRKRIAS